MWRRHRSDILRCAPPRRPPPPLPGGTAQGNGRPGTPTVVSTMPAVAPGVAPEKKVAFVIKRVFWVAATVPKAIPVGLKSGAPLEAEAIVVMLPRGSRRTML